MDRDDAAVALLFTVIVGACSPRSAPLPPQNTVVTIRAGHTIDALIDTAPTAADCPLRWNELDAPPRIALKASGDLALCAGFTPEPFKPDTCEGRSPDTPEGEAEGSCELGVMRGGTRAVVQTFGPQGFGRNWSVGIAIDSPEPRVACFVSSTVGYVLLSPVGEMLAPLPWFADIDHSGGRALVLWQRVPWADSQIANGLYPVAYVLDGDELVRRDDLARPLRVRVAAAYRELLHREPKNAQAACVRAFARALVIN